MNISGKTFFFLFAILLVSLVAAGQVNMMIARASMPAASEPEEE